MRELVVTGLNHKSAPVALRERFNVAAADLPKVLRSLKKNADVHECLILSTCNRVELYTMETVREGMEPPSVRFFHEHFAVGHDELVAHLYRYTHERAVEHLFAVASSLDSMIVGEPQILGQVKEAYGAAQRAGSAGPVFHRLFAQALHVGKRVRHSTDVGRLAVSVPYAAVELARRIFENVEGRRVVVIGRGEMSELALRHLDRAGAGATIVVGRCFGHACEFAKKFAGAVARPYDTELRFLDDADIVLASTRAPHYLIGRVAVQELMRRRRNRVLLLVDISVPRVIEESVNELENVYLFNIDHLQNLVDANYNLRLEEAAKARELIADEVGEFLHWLEERDLVPTIQAFRNHLEKLLEDELQRALGARTDLAPEARAAFEGFGRALINKISHRPITCLKKQADPYSAAAYRDALRELFELDKPHDGGSL
jgi:glutamyl-tRNA reductase